MLTVTRNSLIIVSAVFSAHCHPCPPAVAPQPNTGISTPTHGWAPTSLPFLLLVQIRESGRKNVDTSKAAIFLLEGQRTTEENR